MKEVEILPSKIIYQNREFIMKKTNHYLIIIDEKTQREITRFKLKPNIYRNMIRKFWEKADRFLKQKGG